MLGWVSRCAVNSLGAHINLYTTGIEGPLYTLSGHGCYFKEKFLQMNVCLGSIMLCFICNTLFYITMTCTWKYQPCVYETQETVWLNTLQCCSVM